MAWTPNESAYRMTPERETEINNADAESIKLLMKRYILEDGQVVRDTINPDVLLEVENPPAIPQRFAERVLVNGKTVIVEADSQEELNRAVIETYKSGQGQPQAHPQPRPQPQQQPRANDGRFRSPGDDVLENLLATRGITLDDLQLAVSRNFTSSWAEATQEFLSTEGANWPGGDENLRRISNKILELGLMDSSDRVGALATAYRALRDADQLLPNPAAEREREYNEAIASATSPAEIAEISRFYQRG